MNKRSIPTIGLCLGLALFAFAATGVNYVNVPFNPLTRWLCLAFLGIFLLSKGQVFKGLQSGAGLLICAFLAWAVLSSSWSSVPELSLPKSLAYILIVLVFTSAGALYTDRVAQKDLLLVFVPLAILMFFAIIGGTAVDDAVIQMNAQMALYKGLTNNSNFLGILILVSLPLLLWQVYLARHLKWTKLKAYALVFFAMAVLLATYSRASILSTSVVIFFFVYGVGLRRYLPVVMVTFLAIVVTSLSFPNLLKELETLYIYKGDAEASSVFDSREMIWEASVKGAREGAGTGLGFGVSANYTDYDLSFSSSMYGREKGNSYLAIIEELGVFGFALYSLMTLAILRRMARAFALAQSRDDRVLLALILGSIVALTINAQFEAWLTSPGAAGTPIMWTLIGMGLVLSKRVIKKRVTKR